MTFEELESKYYELKGKQAAGLISNEEFLAEVEKLSLQDEQGRWWMIGAKTGKWYVSQEGEWVQQEPPRAAPERVCPDCGAPVEEEAVFCGSCGYRLVAEPDLPAHVPPPPPRPKPPITTAPAVAKRPHRGLLIGVMVLLFLLCLGGIALGAYEYLSPTKRISTRLVGLVRRPTLGLGPTSTPTTTPAARATAAPTYAPTPSPSATPVNPDLPDLIVNGMWIQLETGDDCDYTSTALGVRVWVENIGGDACPFVVDVNGSQQDISSGLEASQVISTWLADAYTWAGEYTAFVDATFLVEESNEDNNQLTQFLPIPTLPPTCTPTATPMPAAIPSPTLVPTSTPLPTATPVPPTPTPSPLPPTLTPTMVPTTSHVGLDAETALAILPSAAELGVDRLEFEEFMQHDRSEEFGDLAAFRVQTPDGSIYITLVVFANADDAHLSMDREFIVHKSQGFPPVWQDLGDESFYVKLGFVVRVERYILMSMGILHPDWLRPSLQRLQTLVPSPRPTVSALLCYLEVWDWFERALERLPGLPEKIGCPIEEHHVETAVSQDFQGGYMVWVWRGGWKFIYVLYDEGGWESYSDRWQEGMPELDSSFGPPPEGVIQPKRGFGLVWQEHPEVREGLGWAFNEERACDGAHLQEFQRGLMIECTQFVMPRQKTRVFILFDDGTYTIYMP